MDLLTSLNSNGSGIDIRELAQTLSNAEITPRRALITDRIDRAELQLSGYAQLRGQAEQVGQALGLISGLSPYTVTSSDPAVSAEITDPTQIGANDTLIEVTDIAKAQILNFAGFDDADAALGGGTLTVEFGSWSDDVSPVFTAGEQPSQTLSLSDEASLNDLATAFSSLDGVSAQVIAVGDGTYTLGLISETGAENALNISFTPPADPGGDPSPLEIFDISDDPSTAQTQAAQNAEFTVNGIAVTRASNEIDDVLQGVSLTITEPTDGPVTLQSRANTEGALEVMRGFVDILNVTNRLVDSLTDQGFSTSGDRGSLAGERLADQFITTFERNLGQGYGGDGDSTFLSDLGILTERDGTLSLDETRFAAAINTDPARLNPLLRDTLKAEGATLSGAVAVAPPNGTYDFTRDTLTGDATLNGTPVSGEEQSDGSWLYTVTTGSLRGISLSVEADTSEAQVTFATSLVSTLAGQVDDLLASNGPLATRDNSINNALSDDAQALEALDSRAQEIEARYLAQFTQMEQIITQLNSTSAFIDDLMNSLNPER